MTATREAFSPEAMAILHEEIPRLASRKLRRHAGVPKEDLEQEMWLGALERSERVEELAAAGNQAAIRGIVGQAADGLLRAEERQTRAARAAAEGYAPGDEMFYSKGQLRILIAAWLDNGVQEHAPKGREAAGGARPGGADYGEWLAMMLDIQEGMRSIQKHHARLLARYYAYPQGRGGWTHEEIASALGIEPVVLRRREYAALKALQGYLGGASPYRKGEG